MPIYLQIDRLEHTATIVAHGKVSDEDIRGAARQVTDADIGAFAKIIDTSGAVANVGPPQIEALVKLLRDGADGGRRGPVACVVDPKRTAFAQKFADASRADRPIRLFTSLREARQWVAQAVRDHSS
jgi:hypothetical protein